ERFNGLTGIPLYHPPRLRDRLSCLGWEPFVLSVGRLEVNKRVDLLIRAMPMVPEGIHAVVAGDGPQRAALEKLAWELGVEARVIFTGRVDDENLLRLYGTCGAVYYAPYDEDLGYVTLEAFLAGKPVLSCHDAGGVLEFLVHGESGLVVMPEAAAVADAAGRLAADHRRAEVLGEAGRRRVASISWHNVIQTLLEGLGDDRHD
ncbi:glycosyltransferase, partial [bacterium]|nr:glycosyltransferase [candidate division CSSED10-310 bacterium]